MLLRYLKDSLAGMVAGAVILSSVMTISAAEVDHAIGSAVIKDAGAYSLDEMLQYALEDERMAQAEYEAIMDAFDISRPFENIAKAELIHETAVIGLYESRGLEVPEFNASAYVIIPTTLEEVFEIGVEAEINNIAMYDRFLEQSLDEDVRAVFQALRDASVNHLAAFERGVSGGQLTEGYGHRGNVTKGAGTPNSFGQGYGMGSTYRRGQ